MSQYIRFVDVTRFKVTPDGPVEPPTRRLDVVATLDEAVLGSIAWFGRWRQYAFFPAPGTIFNPGCLAEIALACDDMTKKWRQRKSVTARQ